MEQEEEEGKKEEKERFWRWPVGLGGPDAHFAQEKDPSLKTIFLQSNSEILSTFSYFSLIFRLI